MPKRTNIFRQWLLWVLLGSSAWLYGQTPVPLKAGQEMMLLDRYVWILPDPDRSFAQKEVLAGVYDGLFVPARANELNFSVLARAGWCKIVLEHPHNEQVFLGVNNRLLTKMQLFRQIDKRDFEEIPAAYRKSRYGFDLPNTANPTNTYYFYAESNTPLMFHLSVGSLESYYEYKMSADIYKGIHVGIILAVIFYHLYLFFRLRDRAFLYFTAYLALLIMMVGAFGGYWLALPEWLMQGINEYALTLVALMGCTKIAFSYHLLRIRELARWLRRPVAMLYAGYAGIIPVTIFSQSHWSVVFLEIILIVAMSYYLVVCIKGLKNGYSVPKYYLVAVSGNLLGAMAVSLQLHHWLPGYEPAEVLLAIGHLVEIGFLSAAFAEKLRLLRQEEERQRQEKFKELFEKEQLANLQNKVLEEKVKERTAQIAKQKEKVLIHRRILDEQNFRLEQIVNARDKFFSIIAHDLKSPLNSLTGGLSLLTNNADLMEKEEIQMLSGELYKSVQNTQDLLNNLLAWANAQTGNLELRNENIPTRALIERNMALFEQTAKNKQISLELNIAADAPEYIFADKNTTDTVVRNLISNALKYTYANGCVCVRVLRHQQDVEVQVEDSGTGIPPEIQEKLFQLGSKQSMRGTSNESGTGLGLLLCKEFVERNGGQLWFESTLGKGSIFHFTLPCA
jgi:signal transduction histidine kinase